MWNKTSHQFTVVPVKADTEYAYIRDLQRETITARLQDTESMRHKRDLDPEDPSRTHRKTLAPYTPPPSSQLAAEKETKSRFKSS